eukprot:scaffold57840_cov71-Phaeocystis_antarctica.AAC.2
MTRQRLVTDSAQPLKGTRTKCTALSRGRGHSALSRRPFRWPIPSWPYHLSSSPPQPRPDQLNLSCLGRPIPTAGLAA